MELVHHEKEEQLPLNPTTVFQRIKGTLSTFLSGTQCPQVSLQGYLLSSLQGCDDPQIPPLAGITFPVDIGYGQSISCLHILY